MSWCGFRRLSVSNCSLIPCLPACPAQLAHPSLKLNGVDLRQLELIVADDAKSRYSLTQFPSAPASIGSPSSASSPAGQSSQASAAADGLLVWYIRANQGHSLELNEMEAEMRRVERVESAGLAVHGTYEKHWPSICASWALATSVAAWADSTDLPLFHLHADETGLQKMTRQHIHLALTLPSSSKQTISAIDNGEPNQSSQQKTVSGIRPSADLYIYLDVPLLLSRTFSAFFASHVLLD